MNQTALIALLELKGLITRDEGEKLVEFLNNKPQPTALADAVEQVSEFIESKAAKLLANVRAETRKITNKTADEVAQITAEVEKDIQKVAEKVETVATAVTEKTDPKAKKSTDSAKK